jgi:hypothetical protein
VATVTTHPLQLVAPAVVGVVLDLQLALLEPLGKAILEVQE